jgi:hypothetical protein
MAASYQKFQDFAEQLVKGIHHCEATGDVLKVALSNTAPVATNTVFANITEIAAGFGYTAGGEDVVNTVSEASGTATVGSAASITWTAAGGSIGPFRYIVLYNDTVTSPADALIAWWDYGSSITLADTETFQITFGSSSLFTVA